MFCTRCGSQLGAGVNFCTSCGNRVNTPTAAPPPSSAAVAPVTAQRPQSMVASQSVYAPPQPKGPSQTCQWCGAHLDAIAGNNCPRCGAVLQAQTSPSLSGWVELPPRKDMAKLQFGNSSCQIEGLYVPVAEMNLAPEDSVYFSHHVLLWMDPR